MEYGQAPKVETAANVFNQLVRRTRSASLTRRCPRASSAASTPLPSPTPTPALPTTAISLAAIQTKLGVPPGQWQSFLSLAEEIHYRGQ